MKPLRIVVGVVLAFVVGALAVALLSARPGVSMTLVEYKKWQHGAMIRLSNNSRTTIRYLADYDGSSSAGSLLFRVQKMSNGWTTASTPIKSMLFPDPRTGMTNEYFFSAENVKPGESLRTFLTRDLKPGRSAEFWVWREPGASPIRVGTICLVPQSKLAARWQPWLARIKGWCGIKATVPGQIEVCCPTSLHTPSPVQPAVAY